MELFYLVETKQIEILSSNYRTFQIKLISAGNFFERCLISMYCSVVDEYGSGQKLDQIETQLLSAIAYNHSNIPH